MPRPARPATKTKTFAVLQANKDKRFGKDFRIEFKLDNLLDDDHGAHSDLRFAVHPVHVLVTALPPPPFPTPCTSW